MQYLLGMMNTTVYIFFVCQFVCLLEYVCQMFPTYAVPLFLSGWWLYDRLIVILMHCLRPIISHGYWYVSRQIVHVGSLKLNGEI